MIQSLHVHNFVLMDDCRIEFDPGLNVLTGETGAGKSLLVGALSLLVGERGSSESVRDPDNDAYIEAAFDLSQNNRNTKSIQEILDQSGISWNHGELLIRRTFSSSGRNRIFLNNTQCLLKVLKEIGALLVDLHGQHEHQSLLQKSSYLPLLDRFGSYDELLDAYRETYQNWKQTSAQRRNLEQDEREQRRREDMLRYQVNEIDQAELQDGEEETIASKLAVMQHAEKLHESLHILLTRLNEGDEQSAPILDELDRMETVLSNMEQLDSSLLPALKNWQTAAITLREVHRDLESYQNALEFDPDDLSILQERYFVIKNLKNKYGSTIPEILRYRDQSREELDRIEHWDEERERLQKKERELYQQLYEQARQLHEKRVATAKKIAAKICAELKPLGMHSARFDIRVHDRSSSTHDSTHENESCPLGPEGTDEVDFLITTIPDKPLRPLREIASGGEISRIMLAIKCVLGQADPVPLMVFDEIDMGVGGGTASQVADRLASLSREKQVLCITHLPQIASRATRNLRVNKRAEKGRLFSTVTVLKGKDRENEIARMLGGSDSSASRKYAREMLQSTQEKR